MKRIILSPITSLATCLAGALWLAASFAPLQGAIVGQWNFTSGLSASTGIDLEYFDGPGGPTEAATQFGTTTSFGIPNAGGQVVNVMRVPKNTSTMGYVLNPNAAGNGGGGLINQYSLVLDVYFPAASGDKNRCLLQIDEPWLNSNEGEFYVGANNGLGTLGGLQGTVASDTWQRLVITVDLAATPPRAVKYINGVKAGEETLADVIDGRWALGTFRALLFTDNAGQFEVAYVNSLQLHDAVLSPGHAAALGAPAQNAIPTSVTPIAIVDAIRPPANNAFVLPGTLIEADILPAGEPIPPESVQLWLDGVSVSRSITFPSAGVMRVSHNPGLLAPKSFHTVKLSYVDPAVGTEPRETEWAFRMSPYHLAGTAVPGAIFAMSMEESPILEGTRVMDASGQENHGTFRSTSGADRSVAGAIGKGILFGPDGANHIQLDKPWSGTPNTFSAWVNVSSSIPAGTRPGVIAGNYNDANNINWELHTSGRPRLYWNNGNPDWNINGIDLRTDQWEHIVFVRDTAQNRFKFYRNGALAAVQEGVGLNITPATLSFIGADKRGAAPLYFQGAIDEMAIYSRPLNDDEAWQLYARSLTLPVWNSPTPWIVDVNPPDGASGVERLARIEVTIDQNFSQTQLNTNSIELRLNGNLVAHTVVEESGTFTVRHQVTASLAANASNTVEIRYLDNGAPATLTVKEWSFVTAAGASIVSGPKDQFVFAGQTALFSVTADVTPPVVYQWRRNGIDIPNATNRVLVLPNAQLSDSGSYTVLVSDAGGSPESEPGVLTVVLRPLPALVTLPSGPPPASNPVFFMPMNEESVTAFSQISDVSTHANHGTFQTEGSGNKSVPGAIGNGILFGPDQLEYISLTQPWAETPNTFSAWVKVSPTIPDLTRPGVIAGNFNDPNNINWELHQFGRPRVYWNNSPSWIIDGIDLRTGEWEHITFVRDSAENRFTFYWNGVPAATLNNVGANIVPETASFIGADKRGAATIRFQGAIDEMAIYGRALSPEEVRQLHARHIALTATSFATPRVWRLLPLPAESAAALGSVIEAVVNDSYSVTDVNPATLQLLLNGAPVSASVTYTNGYYIVRHIPAGPLASGTQYTAEIRFQDTNGANISQTWQFTTALGPPVVTIPPRSQTVREGTDLHLWVEAQTTPPVSYQWFRNDVLIENATNNVLELRNVSVGSASYSVHISDAGGSANAAATLTVIATIPSTPATSLGIGLTAHWPFDDDFSSEVPGFTGVPHNAPTIASPGRIGSGAAQFVQASQSHLRVNRKVLVDQTLEYTVAGWFNLAGGSGRRALWETSPTSWPISAEVNTAGTIAYFIRDAELTSRTLNTQIAAVVGQWHHVVVIFNGRDGFSRIYVDGQDAGSITAHPPGVGTAPISAFYIGTFRDANARFFDGQIDDLGLWNRALTADEIAYLAAGNAIPPVDDTPPLMLHPATIVGTKIRLSWQGGQPPYQVQRRASLSTGSWVNLGGPTNDTSAEDDIGTGTMFYRVQSN